MTHHPPTGPRLAVTPVLDVGDVAFLAGFSRHAGRVARIWPGQPAVPSPWVPCSAGCCLVLVPPHPGGQVVAQWLRFLIAEFLAEGHRVDGRLEVPGQIGWASTLLIVEAGEVFQGEIEGLARPQPRIPAARAGSA